MEAKISGNLEVAKAVLQAEEQRLVAMRTNDATALSELLADNLVYVFSSAIIEDKPGYLIAIKHKTMRYEDDLHLRDVEVRAFSENAVITGILESHIWLYGARHHSVNQFTMVWVNNNERWQMCNWQSTPVPTNAE